MENFRALCNSYPQILRRPIEGFPKFSFLNELCCLAFGGKNARKWSFGVLTQANWQGAPSRGSVQPFKDPGAGFTALCFGFLLGRLPTQCNLPP
jgi:hypothetical protein